MTGPAFFELTRSDLNSFLHAPVGVERNGMTLSVFSGFARLDLDPWAEAERLIELPNAKATEALAQTIARMSGGWLLPEARRIAERLMLLLPTTARRSARADADKTDRARPAAAPRRHAPGWLFWLLLAALALVAIMNFVA